MISKEELLKTPEYWFETIQNEIFRQMKEYLDKEGLSQSELAEKLGVTKGYISQIMNGNFNYTLKKLIELSLAMGKAPVIEFEQLNEFVNRNIRQTEFQYSRISKFSIGSLTHSIPKNNEEYSEYRAHKQTSTEVLTPNAA